MPAADAMLHILCLSAMLMSMSSAQRLAEVKRLWQILRVSHFDSLRQQQKQKTLKFMTYQDHQHSLTMADDADVNLWPDCQPATYALAA
jgi:hypothetical protein